jgi:hypothetical protein
LTGELLYQRGRYMSGWLVWLEEMREEKRSSKPKRTRTVMD